MECIHLHVNFLYWLGWVRLSCSNKHSSKPQELNTKFDCSLTQSPMHVWVILQGSHPPCSDSGFRMLLLCGSTLVLFYNPLSPVWERKENPSQKSPSLSQRQWHLFTSTHTSLARTSHVTLPNCMSATGKCSLHMPRMKKEPDMV